MSSPQNSPCLVVSKPDAGVVTLELNRPHVRHALNNALLESILKAIEQLSEETHIVCLRSSGPTFCAGADLHAMREHLATPKSDETVGQSLDAALLERCFYAIESAPQIFVACVQGHAYGGGAGLVAACDLAIASSSSRFVFSECRLGLVAATIAPYVVRRMGVQAAKTAFLLATPIAADKAEKIGLIDAVAQPESLDSLCEDFIRELKKGGPSAHAQTKALLLELVAAPRAAQRKMAQAYLDRARASAEGQEGMLAFFERREPCWRL